MKLISRFQIQFNKNESYNFVCLQIHPAFPVSLNLLLDMYIKISMFLKNIILISEVQQSHCNTNQ